MTLSFPPRLWLYFCPPRAFLFSSQHTLVGFFAPLPGVLKVRVTSAGEGGWEELFYTRGSRQEVSIAVRVYYQAKQTAEEAMGQSVFWDFPSRCL